jgi:competence protein ComEA
MKRLIQVLFCAALVAMASSFAAASTSDDFISFNTAPAERFMKIQVVDVPEALAKAIVSYRKANGPYKTPEDLKKVPGMTDEIYDILDPIEEDGDIVFEKQGPGGMNAY